MFPVRKRDSFRSISSRPAVGPTKLANRSVSFSRGTWNSPRHLYCHVNHVLGFSVVSDRLSQDYTHFVRLILNEIFYIKCDAKMKHYYLLPSSWL
jgi:hypothetical protein